MCLAKTIKMVGGEKYIYCNFFFLSLPTTPVLWGRNCGGSDGKESAYNSGDLGSIPGSGSSPAEGNGNPLQCSCLENPRDGGAWWAAIHGVAQSQTRLKRPSSGAAEQLSSSFSCILLAKVRWGKTIWVIDNTKCWQWCGTTETLVHCW